MVVHSSAMSNPFDSAWALLKGRQRKLDLGERPRQLHQKIRLRDAYGSSGLLQQREKRKELDKTDRLKQQLNQHIPRVYRNPRHDAQGRNEYTTKVNNKEVGSVKTQADMSHSPLRPSLATMINVGEIEPHAQRRGLYGSTLSSIINDTGNLYSTDRNENSQPFHEQFNPPGATKNVHEYNSITRPTTHQYGYQKNTKETPPEWGDLEYSTGALPVYDNPPQTPPPLPPMWPGQSNEATTQLNLRPEQQTFNGMPPSFGTPPPEPVALNNAWWDNKTAPR